MNQTTVTVEKKKSPLMKFLAVVLFIILITFCAWAAVRLVTILPTAFSSLANLAENVYQHDPYEDEDVKVELVAETNEIDHDTTFNVSWNEINTKGQLTFSYECVDGISLQITVDGETYNVTCGEDFYLPDNISDMKITIASEKLPVAYVPYTIKFTPDKISLDIVESTETVTVLNDDIPNRVVDNGNDTTDEENTDDESTDGENEVPATKTVKVYHYALPTSDPNGYTDLAVEYLGVGVVNSNGLFTSKTYLDEDDDGAFQFSVKNIGTKTSDKWYFEGETTSGSDFKSGAQKALKPNERAVITIGFPNTGDDGYRRFGITIHGGNDVSSNNNGFSQTVMIR